MKKRFVLLSLLIPIILFADEDTFGPVSLNISLIPPQLSAEVTFQDENGNLFLDAEERGYFVVVVKNTGKGEGNVDISITCLTEEKNLSYKELTKGGIVKPGEEWVFKVKISADEFVENDKITF